MKIWTYLDKRTDRRYPCPFCGASKGLAFHEGKNASSESGFYHCFSCGSGGDGLAYLQRLESMSYRQASAALGLSPVLTTHPRRRQPTDTALQACRDLVAITPLLTDDEYYRWMITGGELLARLDHLPEVQRHRARLKAVPRAAALREHERLETAKQTYQQLFHKPML